MIKFSLFLLAALSFTHAHADADTEKVKAALKKSDPQLDNVENIKKSNIPGLYEVVIQGQLMYADESGQFIINGSIYDIKNKRNLTDERSRQLFKVDFDKLPFDLAIKKVRGNGKRKMAYFTDPNCGYCQKLEAEMKDLNNFTLHIFMMTTFAGSAEKVKGVLCSKNPVKAWDNLMLKQIQPPTGTCDTPSIEQVMQLSRKLRVNGTPAMFFTDGILVPGYMSVAEIEDALNRGGKVY